MSSKLMKCLVTVEGVEHEADTAKEVSRLLGRKVTRMQILSCMVPEVRVLEDNVTKKDDDLKKDDGLGTVRMVNADGTVDTLKAHDILDKNESSNEAAISGEVTQEDLNKVEEILNGEASDEEKDTVEDYIEENTEETIYCDNCGKEVGSTGHLQDSGVYLCDECGGVNPISSTPVICAGCGKEIAPEEERYVQDDDSVLCEECNHTKSLEEDDPSSVGKTKMDILMEKMRKLNATKGAATTTSTTTKSKKTDAQAFIKSNNGYPEVGFFKEEKDLKKFYKQLEDSQIDEWLEIEGLTYKPSGNEPINRMRKCMAILYCHFPRETKGTSKSKSKYADYTTEELLQMALDNNVEVKEGKGDPRILRMYCIMSLKKAGLLE